VIWTINKERFVFSAGGLHTVWSLCGYASAEARAFTISHLTEGKKWLIRVSAENDDGRSEPLNSSITTESGEHKLYSHCYLYG